MFGVPPIRAAAAALLALSTSTPSTVCAQDVVVLDIDPSTVLPKSRLLTVHEFLAYLETEAGVEFEAIDEFADGLDMTLEELGIRSEEAWQDASMFEFARAVRDGSAYGMVHPFLLCDTRPPDGQQRGSDSGFARRKRLVDAVRAASAATNVTLNENDNKIDFGTIYNGKKSWCGFANLNGVVAEAIEGGDDVVVQPFVMAMKMAAGTVDAVVEKIEEFYDDSSSVKDVIEDVEDLLEEEGGDGTRRVQEEKRKVFPRAVITLCSNVIEEEEYYKLLAGEESSDWTTVMTEWLLGKTNVGDETTHIITENVYWSNPRAKSLAKTTTDRGKLWEDTIRLAFEGDKCDTTFANRLKWTVQIGNTPESPQGFLIEFIDTDAEAVDDFCILGLLAAITVKNTVCQIEIEPEKSTSNAHAQWMVQTGVVNQKPLYDLDLDGSGQVVAVSDTGIDVNNCYFDDPVVGQPTQFESSVHRKIFQYDPYINDDDYQYGHGTHVAGTIAGKRVDSTGLADGVAPGAKIAFIDIGYNDGSLSLPSDTTLLGTGRSGASSLPMAHIHSASWGSRGVNGYSYQARSFDDYMFDHDDFLVVVAAGNDGRYDLPNTVGAPATAKNVLAVGASHSYGGDIGSGMLGPAYIADFSSRGPTADGRMKPDIVAPGKYILSAGARPDQPGACDEGEPKAGGSKGGVTSMAGTSMATPVTSGTAALIRQYFEEGWYEDGTKNSGDAVNPSGALVKAVLMNGAQTNMKGIDNSAKGMGSSVTDVQPYDNAMGFGRISLTHSLYLKGKSDVGIQFWDRESVTHDGLRRFPVTIDKSNGCTSDQLSVTLVWVERGSAANCVRCLLNDLDLYVTNDGDETKTYYPNGRTTKDDTNNAERVIVNGVIDGDSYTITVDPYNLDTAEQQFSLVATGCFSGVVANTIDTSQNVFTTDESESSKTTTIIIVCCVVGGVIVLCLLGCFIKKRRAVK